MIADNQKTCTDCKTRKTPLWRVGPAGPKTLCNACGIKYRKRKVPSVKGQEKRDMGRRSHDDGAAASSVSSCTIPASAASEASIDGDNNFSVPLKIRLKALGKEFLLHRSPSIVKRQKFQKRRKLGEEEQAAFCLMALSCGYIFV